MPRYDYHVHTNYSDGDFLWQMARAADRAGLEGVGFADHCSISTDPDRRAEARRNGFALDLTHERRREAIADIRAWDRVDVEVYDAVEMDYDPDDEAEIEAFLADAGFEYALGSVHHLDGTNVHVESHFAGKPGAERQALVDGYFEDLVTLVDSELFEIAAHVDIVERNPALRGFATEEHYHRLGEALADSRTVPEVNAGRATEAYGEFHPRPACIEILRDHGVEFVVGSDAHSPEALRERAPVIDDHLEALDLAPATLSPR